MLLIYFLKNVSVTPSDKKHEVIRPLVRGPWLDQFQRRKFLNRTWKSRVGWHNRKWQSWKSNGFTRISRNFLRVLKPVICTLLLASQSFLLCFAGRFSITWFLLSIVHKTRVYTFFLPRYTCAFASYYLTGQPFLPDVTGSWSYKSPSSTLQCNFVKIYVRRSLGLIIDK
jgi:hypothetical protein